MTREQNERNDAVGRARAQALLDQLRGATKHATLEWAEGGASRQVVGAATMTALHAYVKDTLEFVSMLFPSVKPTDTLAKLLDDLQRSMGIVTPVLDAQVSEMVLHDGEDESKTIKLHALLENVDWDGEESGVSVFLHASVGDTLRVRRDARGVMIGVAKPGAGVVG
jgi:hypothetical protein